MRWLALGALVAGCGPSHGVVQVRDAVVRVAPVEARNAAGYFVLINAGRSADTLRAITSDAGPAELHRTTEDGGLLRMEAVARLPVAAGDAIRLEPGGYHVMIRPLTRALAAGDSVALVLEFARRGPLTVHAPVRPVGSDD